MTMLSCYKFHFFPAYHQNRYECVCSMTYHKISAKTFKFNPTSSERTMNGKKLANYTWPRILTCVVYKSHHLFFHCCDVS